MCFSTEVLHLNVTYTFQQVSCVKGTFFLRELTKNSEQLEKIQRFDNFI